MGEKSESEKYVGDIGLHVKLLLQGLKQHLLRNHFPPYFWQFPKSVDNLKDANSFGNTEAFVFCKSPFANPFLLRCLFMLAVQVPRICKYSYTCLTHMFVYLLCVMCELNVSLYVLLVLVPTNNSVVDIEV